MLLSSFGTTTVYPKDNINQNNSTNKQLAILGGGCLDPTSEAELDIGNVRTTILGGGDMWWNLTEARYEIPKNEGVHSLFAGSLWIGGLDNQNNLKIAAMTYRQTGSDFYPGPLNADSNSPLFGSTSFDDCNDYNQHWVISKNEVEAYVTYLECTNNPDCDTDVSFPNYVVPDVITNWPSSHYSFDGTNEYLAPFIDVDGDGIYNNSDYPAYDLDATGNCSSEDYLYGDQSIWWVFNDAGNFHGETGGTQIGLEIQAQAFAYKTTDVLSDMTFYNYKIINRSNETLNETYFGQWVDPDLGNYLDDYVGCDVNLGLGYCYNGDVDDEGMQGSAGYGLNPPAIGVDFFKGPLADESDGIDNDRDGVIDEAGEQIIMSKFVYYNNDETDYGNPVTAEQYYGYLRGIWKNGQPMTYGGNGWDVNNPECNFMFPGDSDPNFEISWDETSAGNIPSDRRFLQSAGPFTLEPGAVNYITVGAVWARGNNGPLSSIEALKDADMLAQDLFDNCFDINYFVFGCTCELANNFDPNSNADDGSCIYPDDVYIDCDGSCILGDSDGDSFCDGIDNCPNISNFSQSDSDDDGIGNSCDNCIAIFNPDQIDSDGDGIGNECDESPLLINENNLKFKIFPNPTQDQINISCNEQIKFIYVFDNLGKRIEILRNDKSFNISNLSKGSYELIVGTEVGNLYKESFIVNK